MVLCENFCNFAMSFPKPLPMTTPTIFKEYIWLVNTIYRAGKISLVDINKKWILTDMSGGVEIPRTTFNRHRDAIEDIFGIYIDCDRKDGYRYYIGNEKVLNEDSVQNWMLSALTVSNIIGESMNLQHRIVLENIPSDGEYLELVIKAMKEGKRISVTYRRYQSSEAKTFTLSPYCIKLFRQRWYLPWLKVLEPEWLAQEIRQWHEDSIRKYQEN